MNQNVYLVSVADECKFTAEEDDSFELSCI